MSSSERYERRLPALLEELAAPRTPDYFDDILGQVDRTRQRPGWTFPERWLPMSAVSDRLRPRRAPRARRPRRRAPPHRPRRGLIALRRQPAARVPAPFGPAGNGLIAYASPRGTSSGDP